MKLLGSTKGKITKKKNEANIPHLEITEVVLVHCNNVINPIWYELFQGCSQMGGKALPPPENLAYITYNGEIWDSYTHGRFKTHLNHVTHHLCSAGISIFSPKISSFCYIKKQGHR